MMIVLVFLHKKRIGFTSGRCSKMYSSVAKLNMMLFDSDLRTSILPGDAERNLGNGSWPLVAKLRLMIFYNILLCKNLFQKG